ncbi:hypothetical protein AALP_AAs44809U000300 [Arabis alpina]|uniref:Uncharacterized protein n=1 Tax=Arabis alpina TaxID=50452 RepID=A0A087G2V6_ARAAL|nr:hypothetical protein AALP_AAs44809U000300 [Arabis alpina]
MGSMTRVLGMIPGMGKVSPAQIREAEKSLIIMEAMIEAMTPGFSSFVTPFELRRVTRDKESKKHSSVRKPRFLAENSAAFNASASAIKAEDTLVVVAVS